MHGSAVQRVNDKEDNDTAGGSVADAEEIREGQQDKEKEEPAEKDGYNRHGGILPFIPIRALHFNFLSAYLGA